MNTTLNALYTLIYIAPAALLAITFHEFAHGFVSSRLGDPTPMLQGRLSLNPLHHLDIMGTLCLVVFGFGWAKPVNVDPRYYKKPKLGMALVGIAGPLMNFIMAFVSAFVFAAILRFTNIIQSNQNYLYNFLVSLISLNIGLGLFNLIPVPPLDGSKVLGAVLPQNAYFWLLKNEKYFYFILIALLIVGLLDKPLMFLQKGIFTWLLNIAFKAFGLM